MHESILKHLEVMDHPRQAVWEVRALKNTSKLILKVKGSRKVII